MKARNKETGEIVQVGYGANSRSNMRLWVEGKFYTDKAFAKKFEVIKQEVKQSNLKRYETD